MLLTTEDEWRTWLEAPITGALQLQRPLPNEMMKVVARDACKDADCCARSASKLHLLFGLTVLLAGCEREGMDPTIPPAILFGLARDILRNEMGKRIEQRRATGRDTPEGARLTQEISRLVDLGKDLDETTARQIIAAGRAAVDSKLAPQKMPRIDAAEIRERYPDLLADDAQVWVGAGWTEILNDAFDAVRDSAVVVRVAREHCAGLHLIIGPKADWLGADFDLAAEVTERTWSRSLQVCETCGQQSAERAWSRYRTRCAEHAEVR
ncbi:hypothetical protein [Methylobacterium durans]|uniref:Uncharacterized protein n=1 Tax=Methylobacterium durans TaxID=2202825 RepID=A0A2U8W1S0_9HYPH|nr:hypothetical protein DK389_02460 [Methylobacterium durans]